MTRERGVASLKILQLKENSVHSQGLDTRCPYHSSNSTLNVLAFENMLSYAPIRVKMESTGERLSETLALDLIFKGLKPRASYRADFAGTSIPSWAMIYCDTIELQ